MPTTSARSCWARRPWPRPPTAAASPSSGTLRTARSSSPPRLRPGRPLDLWVLAALGSSIHLTTGVLPQKRITPSTDEASAAARSLRPVLRAGLTLIGGQGPTTPAPPGDWTFCWREGDAWREAPARSPGEEARYDHADPRLVTGWLRAKEG